VAAGGGGGAEVAPPRMITSCAHAGSGADINIKARIQILMG
jgi:hypothetical protein